MTRRGSEEIIASAHDKIPFFDWFTWLDYFVRVWPLLVASSLKNTIVVADRYAYDVILALHADGSKSYRLVVWLFKLFPQPTIIFYVNVSPELAFARKDDIPSLEFLRRSDEEKRKLIAQLPVEVITLDGTRTVQELTEAAFTITTALIT
jgi:dTMP kinase